MGVWQRSRGGSGREQPQLQAWLVVGLIGLAAVGCRGEAGTPGPTAGQVQQLLATDEQFRRELVGLLKSDPEFQAAVQGRPGVSPAAAEVARELLLDEELSRTLSGEPDWTRYPDPGDPTAARLHVDPDYQGEPAEGTADHPFRTLQQAWDFLPPVVTRTVVLALRNGDYDPAVLSDRQIVWGKAIQVTGNPDNRESVAIRCDRNPEQQQWHGLTIASIGGGGQLHVAHLNVAGCLMRGINVYNSQAVLTSVRSTGNGSHGIEISESHVDLRGGCEADGNAQAGINIGNSNVDLGDSHFHHNKYGILAAFGEDGIPRCFRPPEDLLTYM